MIHPTAIISPNAKLGANVSVGAFTTIYDHVEIGAETVIEGYCEIGYPSALAEGQPIIIGKTSLIRSHSILYQGSTFGERFITGHRVTVREKTEAGVNFQLGTLGDIQGTCSIGDYVRFHSNVFIPQYSRIGNFVWLFPHVVLTNDPHPPSALTRGCTIADFAAIAARSVILPGVTVAQGALVAASSCVTKDVAPHTVVGGTPAKFLCNTSDIILKDGTDRPAYPWTTHFHRGYPENIVEGWLNQVSSLS